MSRQHQTRNSAQKASSSKKQPQFTPMPVIQPKAVQKTDPQLPEWKPGGSGGVSPLARLQKTAAIQAKLTIGQSNDKYEQEADRVARDVVQRIHSPLSDATQQNATLEQEKNKLQTKPMLRRQTAADGGEASTELESSINRAKGSGQSLDTNLQQSMGQAMGADFSGVKVHTDTQSDRLNQSVQAKAFTTGSDVFFRQGEYNPSSKSGQELIAHELTHVVQQGKAGIQRVTNSSRRTIIQRDKDLALGSTDLKSQDYNETDLLGLAPQVKSVLSKFRKEVGAVGPEALGAKGIKQQAVQGQIQPQFSDGIKLAMSQATKIKQNLAGFTEAQIQHAYTHKPVLDSTEIKLLEDYNKPYYRTMEHGQIVYKNITGTDAQDWYQMQFLCSDPDDPMTARQHTDAWHPGLAAIAIWELSHHMHSKELFDKTDFYYYDGIVKNFREFTKEELKTYGIQLAPDTELMTTEELGLSIGVSSTTTSSCCFITTACTRVKGLPDDCEELMVLRSFRDNYLAALPDGPAMIEEYYGLAPQILACIAAREDEEEILARFYGYIVESVNLAKAGKNQEAMQKYIAIVLRLKAEYL